MTAILNITSRTYQPLCEVTCPAPRVLLCTAEAQAEHRWSILGWNPWLSWHPVGTPDPLGTLQQLLHRIEPWRSDCTRACQEAGHADLPVPLLMGGLSYDLGRSIEVLPTSAQDPWAGQQACLYGFTEYIVSDEQEQRAWHAQLQVPETLRALCNDASREFSTVPATDTLRSNMNRAEYTQAVAAVRDMIAAGDCYQVNIAQRYQVTTQKQAIDLLRDAKLRNPAPMMGLIDTGTYQVASTSPETLVQRRGSQLRSRPIKGTRPRGDTSDDDAQQRAALTASEKERAELNMIVDLVRNDLSRVSEAGTVVVQSAGDIESYTNVHHRVATVESQLRSDCTWPDIFRAMFPGASVTGCPKVQAMCVIEQFEGVRRGMYCGSLGYIDIHNNGHWNIAIRTMTLHDGVASFHVGSGIVYDSDPEAEYDETLAKGKTMFELLA